MPYVSDKQRKFFNWKAKHSKKWKRMANEFNKVSKGMKLPKRAKKKKA